MKKMTIDDKFRFERHAELLEKRRLRKRKNNSINSSKDGLRVFSRVRLNAPHTLSLFNDDAYEMFVVFLTKIRDEIEKKNRLLIDFRNTESLKACAVLVLYAHIDFFQKITGNRSIITFTPFANSRANRLFDACGLWSLVGLKKNSGNNEDNLPVVSSVAGASKDPQINQESRATIRQILNFVKDKIYNGNISALEAQNLYAAVTESISNVGLHAYTNETNYEEFVTLIGKRWWIFARSIEEQLFMLVYDMGEGIPLTLVRRDIYSIIMQMFNPSTDAEKINAAVQYGETRMKSDKHGKGLSDIKRYVVDNPMGELHIFSGMGRYSFYSKNKNEENIDHRYSVGGTLIQWNISLGSRNEN